MILPDKALQCSHSLIAARVKPGDLAVDATAGNGADTLFLARMVGDRGRVYAFDIQEKALAHTRERLYRAGLGARVRLVQDSHANLSKYVQEPVAAAMFNLGYLPGGDHLLVTRPQSTLAALNSLAALLIPGGLITIVCYIGHPGGREEAAALEANLSTWAQQQWVVSSYRLLNQVNNPPYLLAVERRLKTGR